MTQVERLEAGSARLEVAPDAGGAITRFALGGHELMRPSRPAETAQPGPVMASFPLVPYSGRVRNGCFSFDGREVREVRNFGSSPHAIHGHGWQAPWVVVGRDAGAVEIAFEHPGEARARGAWPYPYTARQRFELSSGGERSACLRLTTTVENTGSARMPAGIGQHPYFPRTPGVRLRAQAAGMWQMDAAEMPAALHPLDQDHPLRSGLDPQATPLDNAFTGYGGTAVIAWHDRGVRLTMTSGPELGYLVVYTPPNEDYFCVEPVSHCVDAFNLVAAGDSNTGLRILAPGEHFTSTITFDAQAPGDELELEL